MRNNCFSAAALIGACATVILIASAGAALAAVNNTTTRSNTQHNVYFRDLSGAGRAALKGLCAKHGGQVVTNDKGQVGCQVGSLSDSKHIADGAAKGQATE
jgi:hypothetical protein